MNDEPVAWINRFRDDGWLSWDKDDGADVSTPLYTRPNQMTTFTTEGRFVAEKDGSFTINFKDGTVTNGFKDLTENEIKELCSKYLTPKDCNIFTFARAILRKAQEK